MKWETFKVGYGRFAEIVSRVMIGICVAIFIAMVISVSYGVIGRYTTFVKAPRWTQEMAILCMVWLCFVGSGLAVKEGLHVRMTIINSIVPKSVAKKLHLGAYVLLLLVNLFWIVYGIQLVVLTRHARMAATGWPMSLTYLSLVVGGFYGFCMSAYRLQKGGF